MYTFNTDPRTQTEREQLCMNLAYLCDGDKDFTNAIIIEYAALLDEKRIEEMLEYTTKEMRSNV